MSDLQAMSEVFGLVLALSGVALVAEIVLAIVWDRS